MLGDVFFHMAPSVHFGVIESTIVMAIFILMFAVESLFHNHHNNHNDPHLADLQAQALSGAGKPHADSKDVEMQDNVDSANFSSSAESVFSSTELSTEPITAASIESGVSSNEQSQQDGKTETEKTPEQSVQPTDSKPEVKIQVDKPMQTRKPMSKVSAALRNEINRTRRVRAFAWMNLLGDGLHNVIDGVILASAFMETTFLGVATLIALFLHEIPQELGDFAVLIAAGLPRWKALMLNLLCALFSLLGAIATLLAGSYVGAVLPYLLPVALGNFIYIAAADLIPELHHQKSRLRKVTQFAFLVLGVCVMALLLFVEPETEEGHAH